MQYATIHIQANPFVSIWFSRFGNCNAALIVDGRYERGSQGNPSASPPPPLRRRYGASVEEKRGLEWEGGRGDRGGGGERLHCSPILVRADSHEQREVTCARTGKRGEDRWIRATIGIVDFVIRGFHEERVIGNGRSLKEPGTTAGRS